MKSSNTDNDIRVTFTLPTAAAARLKEMADGGSPGLRELGILSVEINKEMVSRDGAEGLLRNKCSAELNKLSFGDSSFDILSLSCKPLPPSDDLENTRQNIQQYLNQPLIYEATNLLPSVTSASGRDLGSLNYIPYTTTGKSVPIFQQAAPLLAPDCQVNFSRSCYTGVDTNVQNYTSEVEYRKSTCGSYWNWQHNNRLAYGEIAVDGCSSHTGIARPVSPMYARSPPYAFNACSPRLRTSTSYQHMHPSYLSDSFSHVEHEKEWIHSNHPTTSPCLMTLLYSKSHVAKNQHQQCGPFETVLALPPAPAKRKFHKNKKNGIMLEQNSKEFISLFKVGVNESSNKNTIQNICLNRKPVATAISPNNMNHLKSLMHGQQFCAAKQLENLSQSHSGMIYSPLHVVSSLSHSNSLAESVLESLAPVYLMSNSAQTVAASIPLTLKSSDALSLSNAISMTPATLSVDSYITPASKSTLNSSDSASVPVQTRVLSNSVLPSSLPLAMTLSASACIIPESHMSALAGNLSTEMHVTLPSGQVPLHHLAHVTSCRNSVVVYTEAATAVHSFVLQGTDASGTKSTCHCLTSSAADSKSVDFNSIAGHFSPQLLPKYDNVIRNLKGDGKELVQNAEEKSSQNIHSVSKNNEGSIQLHQDQCDNLQQKMSSSTVFSVNEAICTCNSSHDLDIRLNECSFSSSNTTVISVDSRHGEMYSSYDITSPSVYMRHNSFVCTGDNSSLSSMPLYTEQYANVINGLQKNGEEKKVGIKSLLMLNSFPSNKRVEEKIANAELVYLNENKATVLNKVCVSHPINHLIVQPSASLYHHSPILEVEHHSKLNAGADLKTDVTDMFLGAKEIGSHIEMGIKASCNNQYGSLNVTKLCTEDKVPEEKIVTIEHDGICCILPTEFNLTTRNIPSLECRMTENLLKHVETSCCFALEQIELTKVLPAAVDLHKTKLASVTTDSNNIECVFENPSDPALKTTLSETSAGADAIDRNGSIQSLADLVHVTKCDVTGEYAAVRSSSASLCKDVQESCSSKDLPDFCSTTISTSSVNVRGDIRENSTSSTVPVDHLSVVMSKTNVVIDSPCRPSVCNSSLLKDCTDRETSFDVSAEKLTYDNSQISNKVSTDSKPVQKTYEDFKSCQIDEFKGYCSNQNAIVNSKISIAQSVSMTVNSLNLVTYSTIHPPICSTVTNSNSSSEFCQEMYSQIYSVDGIIAQNETAFRNVQDSCNNETSSCTCFRTENCSPSVDNDRSANCKCCDVFQPNHTLSEVNISAKFTDFNKLCLPELLHSATLANNLGNQYDYECRNSSRKCPVKIGSITLDCCSVTEENSSYSKVSLPFSLPYPLPCKTAYVRNKLCNSDEANTFADKIFHETKSAMHSEVLCTNSETVLTLNEPAVTLLALNSADGLLIPSVSCTSQSTVRPIKALSTGISPGDMRFGKQETNPAEEMLK